jgi:o-succinylbenzoate---CoA ligase
MGYSFKSIWINGRFVRLDSITNGKIQSHSAFENHTFTFIREWFTDQKNFTIETSGSTGVPKKISFTREQMIASATASVKALTLRTQTSALVCIDTKYIGGKMMLVRSFINDMEVWAVDPCACPLQKIPVDHCVNFTAFVPYQITSMLVSKHPHLLNNPDTIIIGGAPLDKSTIEKLQVYQCRCYATYGMTETISHVALQLLNGRKKNDAFEVLPGVKVEADDRSCLVIQAPYLKQKIVTNDLTEMLGAGRFRWCGRLDNVINTGGIKVQPEKIESALSSFFHEAGITNRFFIHSISDVALGNKVVLVIEASGNSLPHIVEKIIPKFFLLEKFERPREIFTSPSFVITENGKINRFKTMENVHSYHPLIIE